jgi:putative sugar O-methyltransferase
MTTSSKLWEQYTQKEFSNITEDFLVDFRAPGAANKFVAWDPYERSTRYIKFLMHAVARQQPEEFFAAYAKLGNCSYGHPLAIAYGKLSLNADYMAAIEEWLFIKNHIDVNALRNIVEIGAGFGRTCHTLLLQCEFIKTYTIVDLPPMLELSRKYLEKTVPRLMPRIRFVANEDVDAQCKLQADLAINIDSFQEMPPSVIDGYMDRIMQNATHFFCKNPVGKYLPQSVGLPTRTPTQLQDVFSLGYCTDVLDIFDEKSLGDARKKLISAYRPKNASDDTEFEVNGDSTMALFPYFQLVMYSKCRNGAPI